MVSVERGAVEPFDSSQDGHRIGRGGFDPIVGAAAAAKVVIARPGDVVPGDDAEQDAVARIPPDGCGFRRG